jgi:hypothetical protein
MVCKECGGNIHRFGGCNICDMLKARKAPRGVSDDTRFAGYSKVGGAQFSNDEVRDHYTGVAKRAGVDITGKQYFSELAAFPGDPKAWVDSQGDMRRLLEERGWGCSGDLKVKAREMEVAPTHPKLADDIVEDMVEEELYQRHGPLDEARVTVKEFEQVKQEVIETHSAPSHLSG